MLKKTITTKMLIVLISILGVALIFVNYPPQSDKIDDIIANVFATSGIIVGLLLAYIVTKVFSIKAEKEERKKTIDEIAYKVTEFRRALYYIMKCRPFWGNYSDIETLKKYYRNYSYTDIHHYEDNDENMLFFWSEEEDRFSKTRADLYLGIEEVVGDVRRIDWVLDENQTFDYSLEEISSLYRASGVLWYYLSHRWVKFSEGLFDLYELSRDHSTDTMKKHLSNIDDKFSDRELDSHLLAEVGTEIHEKHIEKLFELTRINKGKLPRKVNMLIAITVIVGLFGVILPLLGSFGNFSFLIDSIIVFISVTVLVASIIWILLDLLSIIKDEVKV